MRISLQKSLWPLLVLLAVGLSIPALLRAQMPEQAPEAVRGILQLQFEAGGDHETAGRTLLGSRLALFYQKRDYLPIWMTLDGLIPEADNLFEAVTNAERQGLDPGDYHLDALRQRLTGSSPKEMAELELLLTDAFLRYCLDLRSGRADPRKADPEWFVLIDRIDHLDAMENALAKGRFQSVLDLLAPRDPAYRRLLEALTDYRQMARQGGWPRLDVIGTLREGMTAAEIPVLRERLRRSGDLSSPDTNPFFDPPLTAAVRSFQSRHGLEVDGVVGPRTRAALNIPVEERLDAILLNIERWRWMPRELPDRYLLVNMAGFHLQAVERHRSVLEMRVIVGRDYRQTPAFSEPLRYLVVNPFWNIPPSIAVKDILPQIRKDPDYLRRQGIRVFSDWSSGARELDPATIDWRGRNFRRFPFKLRQDPGPRNALGRIKFMLPNRFDIYLHDTPDRHLFEENIRTFSSGCIRVEDPLRLAAYLLADHPDWSVARLQRLMAGKERQVVRLKQSRPTFLVYWTVWVDDEGVVQFRDDIYGRDAQLRSALVAHRSEAETPRQ